MPTHPTPIDGVSVGLLGPLEARRDGRAVSLPGARLRRLLAILAVDANQVVPADRIADSLWSGDPPATATAALHVLVSRLRQVLEPDRQARSAAGIVATVRRRAAVRGRRLRGARAPRRRAVASGGGRVQRRARHVARTGARGVRE